MAYVRRMVKGSIQTIRGNLYAVVNLYDEEQKRRRKSIDTGYNPRNEKSKANKFLQQVLDLLNSEKYLPLETQFVSIVTSCINEYRGSPNAEKFLVLLEGKLEERRKHQPATRLRDISKDMPFVDFLRTWLRTKTKIDRNTYNGYEDMINGRIDDYFTSIGSTLSNLEAEDFESYYSYLHFDLGLSECTALHHHRLMKQALKYAVKKDILLCNVLDKVDAPADSDFEGDYYKVSEALEMLEVVKSDPLYIVILLTTYYGFRRSEVLGLRWSAIDFDNNIISIERTVVSTRENGKSVVQDKKKTKSKASRRSLPLIPIVAEALKKEKNRQAMCRENFPDSYKNTEGYVCVNSLGKLFKPDYVSKHFKCLLIKGQLRIIRFHDLRHTCATLQVMNGMSLLAVSKWLGHSSTAVTEKYYLHFDVKGQIESAITMGQILPHQLADDVKEMLVA